MNLREALEPLPCWNGTEVAVAVPRHDIQTGLRQFVVVLGEFVVHRGLDVLTGNGGPRVHSLTTETEETRHRQRTFSYN